MTELVGVVSWLWIILAFVSGVNVGFVLGVLWVSR